MLKLNIHYMSKRFDLFKSVPAPKVPKNLFNLDHEVKMSGKFGYLYPVLLVDALPGETWREEMIAMIRLAPMLAPPMHKIIVKTDFFFIPNRLVYGQSLWESFITGGQDGTENPVLPYLLPGDIAGASEDLMRKGTLWDYFGLPMLPDPAPVAYDQTHFNVGPFRAYTKVYNDYFRDPNLDDEIPLSLDVQGDQSGEAFEPWLTIRKRGWERDPFTGALPFAQRGQEVLIPMETTGNLVTSGGSPATVGKYLGISPLTAGNLGIGDSFNPAVNFQSAELVLENSSVTITDFGTSLAMQRWLENNARGGGRYIEQMQSHFDERVPDYRLQRAEYLGGGRQMVRISEVLSTADSTGVPVGDMAGHGISVGKTNRFHYRCQEHGFILGIMSIVPAPNYASQGVEKLWTRETRYEYGFPEFANLGEQPVIKKELLYSFDSTDTAAINATFGYVPRYTEYKSKLDRISGDFRDTLAFWHLARIFTALPALDSQFLRMNEDDASYEESYRRIFAVQDGTDYLWMQLQHTLSAKRPFPYYGVPKLIR